VHEQDGAEEAGGGHAVTDDAIQTASPFAVSGPLDEGVREKAADDATDRADQEGQAGHEPGDPKIPGPLGIAGRDAELLLQVAWPICDIQVPTIRSAKIHGAEQP